MEDIARYGWRVPRESATGMKSVGSRVCDLDLWMVNRMAALEDHGTW